MFVFSKCCSLTAQLDEAGLKSPSAPRLGVCSVVPSSHGKNAGILLNCEQIVIKSVEYGKT